MNLSYQTQHQPEDQFRDDDRGFGHPPAKSNDDTMLRRRGVVQMIGMPACLQNKLKVGTAVEESAVQCCPLAQRQEDTAASQQRRILCPYRVIENIDFGKLT